MPRNAVDMDVNPAKQFFNDNYRQTKALGHCTHAEQAQCDYPRGEVCFRCDQSGYDVKFDGETDVHGRRRPRMKNHAQHCPSCHCTVQSSKYAARETARGGGGVNVLLDLYEDMLKAPLLSPPIKKTQSSTLSPRTGLRCRPKSVSHCRSKRVSSSDHRQMKRAEQDDRLSTMMRHLRTSRLVDDSVEGQHGFPQGGPIKSSLKKDAQRKNHQETRDAPNDLDYETDEYLDGDAQDFSDLGAQLINFDVHDNGPTRQCHRDYQEMKKLMSETREYERFKEQNRQIGESAGIEHRMEGRGKKQIAEQTDEEEQPRRRANYSASKYTAARYDAPGPNSGRAQSSAVKEKSGGKQITTKSCAKGKRGGKNSSKNIASDTSSCEHELDDSKEEQQLDKITCCGEFQSLMMSPDSEYNRTKESEDNAEAAGTDVPHEKGPKEKDEEDGVMQRSQIDLYAVKKYILDLIDKVLSKAFSDVRKNDITKQEQVQQNDCLEIIRLLQGDYCKSLVQPSAVHQTSDYLKQLKNLRFDFLNHIQDEVRKLYNLEMFLNNCPPTLFMPGTKCQCAGVDQRKDDRQQQQIQPQQQQAQQQQQQQPVSQEQQRSSTTVANGLNKNTSQ